MRDPALIVTERAGRGLRPRSRVRPSALTLVRIAQTFAVIAVGFWAARAAPSGATRDALTYAGTLRSVEGEPIAGPVALTFRFKKADGVVCEAPVSGVLPDPVDGAFEVDVPLSTCPESLFDGSDVSVDVLVGAIVAVENQQALPVPYAKYGDSVGTAECPPGYDRRPEAGVSYLVCGRELDEVVRVGSGPAAFWIDRFEASVWSAPWGQGTRHPDEIPYPHTYPATFPGSGQYTVPLYAASRRGTFGSVFITWFQAMAACEASGKRLATVDEFFEAIRGTPDPGVDNGTTGNCATKGSARAGGVGTQCQSVWGAQDMMGSWWEATNELYAGLGDGTAVFRNWPGSDDATWNIVSKASVLVNTPDLWPSGLPMIMRRGGSGIYGNDEGVFAGVASSSPVIGWQAPGFRCVTPR